MMRPVRLNLKPKVEIARSAGWCFGVERIVAMAETLLNENTQGSVYCVGELIHNPQEVARLRAKGMTFVKSPEELPPLELRQRPKVLIRAHGVAPAVKRALQKKGYDIHDGTCPLVTIPQKFARELAEQGYRIVIMGHREHPEIQGILGQLEGLDVRADVIHGPNDVEQLKLKASDRVGLISQTTHPYGVFAQLIGEVLKRCLEVKAYNTICQATFDRQDAIRELAQKCDLIVVIGGRNSSNTCRLAEIASQHATCYHIEDVSELKGEWLIDRKHIGISAGASTPNRCIQEVALAIKGLTGAERGWPEILVSG